MIEPVLPWLIKWSAIAVPRFKHGADTKNPYEKQTGRGCDVEVVPFGDTVLYRVPEVARDRHQALEGRWSKGAWLGHARSTSATLVATDNGGGKGTGDP